MRKTWQEAGNVMSVRHRILQYKIKLAKNPDHVHQHNLRLFRALDSSHPPQPPPPFTVPFAFLLC